MRIPAMQSHAGGLPPPQLSVKLGSGTVGYGRRADALHTQLEVRLQRLRSMSSDCALFEVG